MTNPVKVQRQHSQVYVFSLLLHFSSSHRNPIKPKDYHYNLISFLDGKGASWKGASYLGRDRNEAVLSKQNTCVSSDLLPTPHPAELFVVICFLAAERDVSVENPSLWDTLPAAPTTRCFRRWETPSRTHPSVSKCSRRCVSPLPKPKSSISRILGEQERDERNKTELVAAELCHPAPCLPFGHMQEKKNGFSEQNSFCDTAINI